MLETLGVLTVCVFAWQLVRTLGTIAEGVRYIADAMDDGEEEEGDEDDPDDDTPEEFTPPLKVVGQ
jgi:hypothetical protein